MTHCCVVAVRSYYKVYVETGESEESPVIGTIVDKAKEMAKSRANLHPDWNPPIEDKDVLNVEYMYSF